MNVIFRPILNVIFRPILNEPDLEKVKAEVEEWMKEGGVGEKVHAHLHQKREELDNWAYQYWLRVRIL